MSAIVVVAVLVSYFGLLYLISIFTAQKSNIQTFFNANKQSAWYLVAYGMIGASLSGVTFISVPGWVKNNHFYYFQMVLGYLLGYFLIATILLPVYYRLNLISIYTYLKKRFGKFSYKTGSAFFLLSRIIGASFRLFLVIMVLQMAFFDKWKIPFWSSILITIFLIWLYTHKAGIKTIVWTDTLQTTFMLTAVIITIITIASELHLSTSEVFSTIKNHSYSQMFNFNWQDKNFFLKSFLAGTFIAFVMTGLDQDMMQKNLTVKTLKQAQKNIFWLSTSLLPINLLFMALGVLLYVYAQTKGIQIPQSTDELFPMLALNYFGTFTAIVFLIGVIAAAFSSADSALTALTTSVAIDFLNLDIEKNNAKTKKIKNIVHISIATVVFLVIMIFKAINDRSVIAQIFTVAGYTYGPLLALFPFGLITKRKIKDKLVPLTTISGIIIAYAIKFLIEKNSGYKFGFEFLILNGSINFILLYIISIGQGRLQNKV